MTKNIAITSFLSPFCNWIYLFHLYNHREHKDTMKMKESDTVCIQVVDFSQRSVSHLWISSVHLWPYSQPGYLVPPPPLTFAPPTPHSLSLWRTMMWTWMRKRRERYSWERPQQAIGGRTVEMMATVTYGTREGEEAAWWTAAVGPRSSRTSSHHRQKTVTMEGEPDCPASLWVIVFVCFCLDHTSTDILPPSQENRVRQDKDRIQHRSRFLQITHFSG